jgi:putative transposase
VQRGHNREPCFFGKEDYTSYLHWLGEALGERGMQTPRQGPADQYLHLRLTPKKAEAVQKLIISLGRRYVQYVNGNHRRTGTLWASRYKSLNTFAAPWRQLSDSVQAS